jgi:hypothetical protein
LEANIAGFTSHRLREWAARHGREQAHSYGSVDDWFG